MDTTVVSGPAGASDGGPRGVSLGGPGVFSDRSTFESERDRRLVELILGHPDFRALERQVFDVGGCEHPIRLSGSTVRALADSGEIVSVFLSRDAPSGVVLVRCMNRRFSRCASCARLYQGDTFQLVRAGVSGGKGVPVSVASNPQVFATLTAPSFGAVHRAADPDDPGDVCKARWPARCAHGVERGCGVRHAPGDRLIGQALCPECYDYAGHVLWNARASKLWKALSDNLYHHLARHAGISRTAVRKLLRIEYVRVAEYQARGAIHFHILLRVDGPEGAGSPAPGWVSEAVLIEALASARRVSTVRVPDGAGGVRVLRFGEQELAEPVELDGDGLTGGQVAGYLAKYVSKGSEDAHGSDVPVKRAADIEVVGRTPHVRALMHAAWRLGGLPGLRDVGLRRWCHMLGYGGHVLTASRGYSVTRAALRRARAEYAARNDPPPPEGTVREAHYAYAGRGYGELALEELAEDVREQIRENRESAREAGAVSQDTRRPA